MKREEIEQLIERVEKAEGGDEDLDCAVHVAVFGWKLARLGTDVDGQNESEVYTSDGKLIEGYGYPMRGKVDPYFHLRNPHPANMRNYSRSIDAVVRLIETKLPGCWWGLECEFVYDKGSLQQRFVGRFRQKRDSYLHVRAAKTPALALLSAFLKAYKEQQ